MFTGQDALTFFTILKKYNPQKIIEIGSGHSTCIAYDHKISKAPGLSITCIEPYAQRLKDSIPDIGKITILEDKVQNISTDIFKTLKKDDILFIDSSHVAKLGSDVCYEIFQILPVLNPGVLIHFHDIFYPFDYLNSWYDEGRHWNEAFFLRAFLQNNNDYEIIFFNSQIKTTEELSKKLHSKFGEGGSLWLRKK